MTVRIPKSLVARVGIADLDKAVADHQVEHAAWSAHMERVKADAALPPIPRPTFAQFANSATAVADFRQALAIYEQNVATRHQPYPAPEPHPLVAQALDGFEVFDDSPTPEQVLAEKKRGLFGRVAQAEQDAVNKIHPLGKRRLDNFRESSIREADATLAKLASNTKWKTLIEAGAKLGIVDRDKALDVSKDVENARTVSDTKHLADQQTRRIKVAAISTVAAQAYSDIEDLTLDNVDQFQIPDFSVAK